jgi:RNA polymerase sigma factor (sigma-70 family)
LVGRYQVAVRQFAARRAHCPDDVDELVQEVFCQAWQELSGLRRSDRFHSWLLSLAANQTISHWRHHAAACRRDAEMASAAGWRVLQPDEEYARRHAQDQVRQALSALPFEYREEMRDDGHLAL